ncbi:MAG: hypothetical protein HY805_11195 [Nitrospirae bacterium]|nr:hypothetical protein [Nitrospirota bacterium]
MERCKDNRVVVKMGRKERVIQDKALAGVIKGCKELVSELRGIEPELSKYKNHIVGCAKRFMGTSGTLCFIVDDVSLKVTLRHEAVIPPENISEIKRLLGQRFRDLIRVKHRYVCSQNLLLELKEKGLESLMELKELSPQLTWQEK